MSFWDVTALRTILATETDYDSPGSEELVSQIRENIEALFLLLLKVEAGSATSDPSNDSNGYFYDTAAGWTDDEHNGRTLLITSGTAIGNTYTIDDTVAASDRIACTGDNLYSDGVRSGDTYIILYDLTNTAGHDHDGVNSKSALLADGSITEAKLADSAVAQAKLKSTTQEVSTTQGTLTKLAFSSAGEYGFFPQFKQGGGVTDMDVAFLPTTFADSSYATIIALAVAAGSGSVYAQMRYIQSSGEVFWLFFLLQKNNGTVIAAAACPDHPCFGNGAKPLLVPHPFLDYDPAVHDIMVVTPDAALLAEIRARIATPDETVPDRSLLQVVNEDYELDLSVKPPWPTEPVTVALENQYDARPGDIVNVIKKIIPQPDYIRTAGLKRRKDSS